ncbi:hypothetical protein BOX15_Mlig022881g1 [Macrostomum lignano]|uniref:UBIQUITIN_CONJUGAT_2 domain-containing protein n=2 Tax=Macrostomum lignano TaxID=282301 RepID=A0A1I8GLP7_9PLAT|nr:hypothetical protein BOX15_Mlig022881g1 [Macrostomum lignano]
MSSLRNLKEDLERLKKTFPKTHNIFRIVSSSLDEVNCKFLCNNKSFDLTATIMENYPQTPALWFSDSDNQKVTSGLAELQEAYPRNCNLVCQTCSLLDRLCASFGLTVPPEVAQLRLSSAATRRQASGAAAAAAADDDEEYHDADDDGAAGSSMSDEEDTGFEDYEDDLHMSDAASGIAGSEPSGCSSTSGAANASFASADAAATSDLSCEFAGIDSRAHIETLRRLKTAQREAYAKQAAPAFGSVQATDRLMKELKELYRSSSLKAGMFSVELVNDSLYEWHVHLLRVDPDSPLQRDLEQLSRNGDSDAGRITLGFYFKDAFPFEPPFVRVVNPVLTNGYVLQGGAICMELLTKQGWSSAYSLESLVLQISATLVKGKARVQFSASKNAYSLARAQHSFRALVHIHEKKGWFTPPKEDG